MKVVALLLFVGISAAAAPKGAEDSPFQVALKNPDLAMTATCDKSIPAAATPQKLISKPDAFCVYQTECKIKKDGTSFDFDGLGLVKCWATPAEVAANTCPRPSDCLVRDYTEHLKSLQDHPDKPARAAEAVPN